MKQTINRPEEMSDYPAYYSPAQKSSGALGFFLKSLAVAVIVPALVAFAGFLIFVPWLNLAGALIVIPFICSLFFWLFSKRLTVGVEITRVLTGVVSLVCAWVFVCVLAGSLMSLYGWEPLELEDLDLEVMEVLTGDEDEVLEIAKHIGGVYYESLRYTYSPVRLLEDLAAWDGEGGWLIIALSGVLVQVGLPQLFVRRRRK